MSSAFSSWKNLRRTPYQSITALLVVITTFFLVFVFTTFLYLGDRVLFYFETRPQILVFFETKVTDAEATQAAELISQLDYVDSVTMTGKAEAFANYQAQNADEPLLLSLLTPDLFPVSLSISAKTPDALAQIRTEIDKLDGVDEVDYREDVVNEFLGWTKMIRHADIAICGFFAVQFVLVIMVITSMKIIGHRRKINIMSMLGATRGSIRWIFVREGIWLGIFGGLIAFGLSYALVSYVTPGVNEFLGAEIQALPLPANFLLGQALLGSLAASLLSAFSAWLAATRLIRK